MAQQKSTVKERINRCQDWLQKQNNPKKLSLQNKNDIQFIIETNAHRKKFFLSVPEDDASVPVGVGEVEMVPKPVPVLRLRRDRLNMECGWSSCNRFFSNYEEFQIHVANHVPDLQVVENEDGVNNYACLWDACGHMSPNSREMVRHVNYHAYHAKLLAIGFNGRATLKLERCKKDSSKRNKLPPLISDHHCLWVDCEEKFFSMQDSEDFLCSWAGCGNKCSRKILLTAHVRSHTGERVIACYHCGRHFNMNRKLSDHLLRQNVDPSSGHSCAVCGVACASAYLLREHVRQHVSCYACSLCDMSAPTPAALALHVRYRHMAKDVRAHHCSMCSYSAVTASDLRKHINRHNKRLKRKNQSDGENCEGEVKKQQLKKKYICHICPERDAVIFTRGTFLTTHLVKVHGAQWPCGHSRFRYQKSEDGMYRLTTTRFEVLEVSKKIVDGYSGQKDTLTNKYEFDVKNVAEATATTPKRYEVVLKDGERSGSEATRELIPSEVEINSESVGKLEIEVCDVDDEGNVISKEVFYGVQCV
ncbi:unnamed protein product [Leptidea sinapis]|uniref:C2H2-type domain-containing protein n=1 Tax=Leptidea sinapis TaxID=189913 RepID=A0A5E4QMY6_9NEOP|nr:unnamed protein product [Leptidea sinapis]